MTRRPLIDFALGFLLGFTVFLLIAAIAQAVPRNTAISVAYGKEEQFKAEHRVWGAFNASLECGGLGGGRWYCPFVFDARSRQGLQHCEGTVNVAADGGGRLAHGACMRLDPRRLTQGPGPMGPYARPCARSCVGTVCIGSRDGHTVCSLPPGSVPHGYRHREPPR